MLTKEARETALDKLANVADNLEKGRCPILAHRADKCALALEKHGSKALPYIRAELKAIDDAYETIQALRAESEDDEKKEKKDDEKKEAGLDSGKLAMNLVEAELRRAGEWSEEDARRMYERMRKDRRQPEIGKGVTAAKLKEQRQARLRSRAARSRRVGIDEIL